MSKKKPALHDGMSLRAYCKKTGHRAETVRTHARLYGLATSGKEIVPITVCMTAHDFFASNAALLKRMRASADDEPRAEAERRKAIAQANREELRVARERNEVVSRAEAEGRRLELVRWMVSVFERMPADLHVLLAPLEKHEVKTAIEDFIYNLRMELSK